MFKNGKLKFKEEKRGGKRKKTPQNCKSPTQRQRFMTTVKSVTEKKKGQKLIRFHNANNIDNDGGWGGKRKSKRIYRKSQNIKIINVFLESLLSESFLSLGVTVHLTPPRMLSITVLISGPAVGAAQILVWSYSYVFLPPMSTAIRTSAFSFVGALNDL